MGKLACRKHALPLPRLADVTNIECLFNVSKYKLIIWNGVKWLMNTFSFVFQYFPMFLKRRDCLAMAKIVSIC